ADAPLVRVDLIVETVGIAPGGAVWVGIRQRIAPGWHTYWINPGDSGEALTIEWALPAGFTAEPIVWPHPERIPLGPAMSHGHTGETVLLVRVTAPRDLTPGRDVVLRGHAAWLVCEKICIPEEGDVALTLPVVASPAAPGAGAAEIARARRGVPGGSPPAPPGAACAARGAGGEPLGRLGRGLGGARGPHRGRARPGRRPDRGHVVLPRAVGAHRVRRSAGGAGGRARAHAHDGTRAPRRRRRAPRRRCARAEGAARGPDREPGLRHPGGRGPAPRGRARAAARLA